MTTTASDEVARDFELAYKIAFQKQAAATGHGSDRESVPMSTSTAEAILIAAGSIVVALGNERRARAAQAQSKSDNRPPWL